VNWTKNCKSILSNLIRQGIAKGKTPDEARYAALRMLGGLEQRKEECRDTRRTQWLEDLLQDSAYAVRTLTQTPGFSVIATLVLGLGIGANTAVFTLVNSVLLQPLRFPQPDQLYVLSCKPKNLLFDPGPTMVDRNYLDFRRHNQSFESLSTVSYRRLTLTESGDPVLVTASEVGPDFLRALRVHPAIGREFLPEGRSDPNVVLLSDKLWRSRFGGDTNIIGKGITLDGVSYSVAGVMPSSFAFREAELWMREEIRLDPHNSFFLPVIGRLKPGVSLRQAQAELQAFAARQLLDSKESQGLDAHILPLKELFVADVRRLLLIFAGAVALVFLIACANFANLLLIRGTGRQPEIAVRATLGASRWRLVRQLLAESTLLSFAGATLGILLSLVGVRALLALLPPDRIPRSGEIHVDAWVLVFAFALSLTTGVAFGLAPALQVTRRELRESISEGGRGFLARRERLRRILVTAEIALALVLLVGAGLLVKSFVRMRSVNPGFRSANVLTLTLDLPISRYPTSGAMRKLDEHILASLALLPGAKSVAAVSFLPLDWGVVGDFQLEDGRHLPDDYRVNKPVVRRRLFSHNGYSVDQWSRIQ
jgi:predicted permease